MKKNPVSWWEIASKDAKSTVEFLKKTFDWELNHDPEETYFENLAGESSNGFFGGGIYTADEGKEPSMIFYITVDDVDESVKKVEENGGAIVEGPFDVPGLGRLCLFTEPTGIKLAMIKRSF